MEAAKPTTNFIREIIDSDIAKMKNNGLKTLVKINRILLV
jgi:hypothetical protein